MMMMMTTTKKCQTCIITLEPPSRPSQKPPTSSLRVTWGGEPLLLKFFHNPPRRSHLQSTSFEMTNYQTCSITLEPLFRRSQKPPTSSLQGTSPDKGLLQKPPLRSRPANLASVLLQLQADWKSRLLPVSPEVVIKRLRRRFCPRAPRVVQPRHQRRPDRPVFPEVHRTILHLVQARRLQPLGRDLVAPGFPVLAVALTRFPRPPILLAIRLLLQLEQV